MKENVPEATDQQLLVLSLLTIEMYGIEKKPRFRL